MKPTRKLLTIAATAALLSACGTPKNEGETTETPKPAFTGGRLWSVGGMTIGNRDSAIAPISEEPMGSDASLAGPGALEADLAANPSEPMPEGAAPTLDANIMPDGLPGETPAVEPQSPFDPALQNPPVGTTPGTPAGETPAPPPPAPSGEIVPPPPPPPAPESPAAGDSTPGT